MRIYLNILMLCLALALTACDSPTNSGAVTADSINTDLGVVSDTTDAVSGATDVAVTDAIDASKADANCKSGGQCGLGQLCNAAGVCCPAFGCAPQCPNGILIDANGCETCQCAPDIGHACVPSTSGPLVCNNGEFCAVPVGQCVGPGVCKAIPQTCPALPPPPGGVCGCDGKDYGDSCPAAQAGVSVDHMGTCAVTAKACNPLSMGPAAQCATTEYCALADGQCGSSQGTCRTKPQACDKIYAPVCGCDGTTYGNACEAAAAGVSVLATGACQSPKAHNYYTTCGYPDCPGGWTPTTGVSLCTTEKAGDACSTEGQECDAKAGCGQFLKCATSDPKAVGCPISKAKFKSDVRYVDTVERQSLAAELLDTRLATYRYTAAGPQAPRHLGFIIDDQPGGTAVDAQRDMVDLYGYLSLSVATLQEQQRQIEQLRQEVRELRAQGGRSAAVCR